MIATIIAFLFHAVQQPHISFPSGGTATEEIALRWLHIVFGIIWIGLLYFFNLVGVPLFGALEPSVRAKIYAPLMSRAMSWFRWSAMITVLVGLRYFTIILKQDAANAGRPGLLGIWFGEWFAIWMVAYVIIYALQMPWGGAINQRALRGVLIAIVVIAASYAALVANGGPNSSNSHLSIGIGGGLGLIMLMNAWGVVWRVQKRLIQWNRAAAENGTPMPPEADRLRQWSLFAARVAFWLSFPMLFFMGAADHYPILSSITD